MKTKQAMEIVIGSSLDPKFKRAFQSVDKQFKGVSKDLVDLRKKQQLVKKFEMNTVAVEKARARLNAAQKVVMKLRREMNKTPTKKLSREFEAAKNKTDKLSQSLGRERTKLREVSQAMNKAKINTKKYRDENDRLTRSVDKLTKKQQKLARLTSQKKGVKQGFSNLRGKAMGVAGGGITAGYASAPGSDFQYNASVLQAKSSGMTDAQRIALENQARLQGKRMNFTAPEVLQGQTFLSMAGFKPGEIKDATPGMLNLAAASGMDMAGSADISSNILSAFGLMPKKMGMVSDVLTQTFTSSNVTLEMMGETLKYAAPIAAKTAKNEADRVRILKEMSAFTGLLGNVGIQGSMAGTAMRSAYTRLAAPPKEAQKWLDTLGVVTKDKDGNLREMPKLLAEIQEASGKMGTGDKLEMVTAIFGKYAASSMSELLGQADKTKGGFVEMYQTVSNSQGKAGRVASIMTDNVRSSWLRVKSGFADFGIAVFKHIEKPLQRGFDSLAAFMNKASAWVDQNPKLVKSLGAVAAGVMAIAAGGLVIGVAKLTAKFIGLTAVTQLVRFAPLVMGSKALGKGFMFLARGAIPAVLVALRVVTAAMLANPIGLAVTTIAGGAFLIYRNWDKLQNWWNSWTLKDIGEGVGESLFNMAFAISDAWADFANWWDRTTLAEKVADVRSLPIEIAIKAVKKFRDLWNGLSLKSLVPDIKMPDLSGKWKELKDGFNRGAIRSEMKKRVTNKEFYNLNSGMKGLVLAGGIASSPQALADRPQVEARPVASPPVKMTNDNRDYSTTKLTVYQLPGEDAEDLAERVSKKVDDKKKQRSAGALYDGSQY